MPYRHLRRLVALREVLDLRTLLGAQRVELERVAEQPAVRTVRVAGVLTLGGLLRKGHAAGEQRQRACNRRDHDCLAYPSVHDVSIASAWTDVRGEGKHPGRGVKLGKPRARARSEEHTSE